MTLKKLCIKCNKVIDAPKSYCDECEKKIKTIKNQTYDEARKDDKHHKFYYTKEWRRKREYILNLYNYIDLYELHINKRIIRANTVHHIIEIRDDYSKRLDDGNLFPCSSTTHSKLDKLYNNDKAGTQLLLKKMLSLGIGGYEKV